LDATFYGTLSKAVSEADAITISTSAARWDDYLLGETGILTTIKEGAIIHCNADLDAEQHEIYASFLASKNLSFRPLDVC
jgi:hypothetical protein